MKTRSQNLSRFLIAGMTAFCVGLAFALQSLAQATAVVEIQADEPGAVISTNLFGIFFEEINSAGDGGIYGELIRNRSFEDSTNSPLFWSFAQSGTAAGYMTIDTARPTSATNSQSLAFTMISGTGTVGIVNTGYWGVPLKAGERYDLSFYARGSVGTVTARLESSNGAVAYAEASITGIGSEWRLCRVVLTPDSTDPAARLALRINQPGTMVVDFVSLFPQATFKNRTNGLRPDLLDKLADLRPAFLRFPGGSWVDGMDLANAYHWKPTCGFLPDRPGRTNFWQYMVSNGLGYHEYLQMCEDLKTQPLFNINAGMDVNQNAVPAEQMGPWVQEALDAIEYANGDTNTPYGSQRAINGHPEPFNLQYIEIGNENGGPAYATNYALFYDAIKAKYPAMHLIACAWGGYPTNRPVEIMDEHYYASAATILSYANRFDAYNRNGPKVFVGEYAVAWAWGSGFPATLNNALAEAAFLSGMERNSDIVTLSCYAPLFANLNNVNWSPNLIYFDSSRNYGTPSYYVQKLFSENKADWVLPTSVAFTNNAANATVRGGVGLSPSGLFVTTTQSKEEGTTIIKAVNPYSTDVQATFQLKGAQAVDRAGTIIRLTSATPGATNSVTQPALVYPVTNIVTIESTNFDIFLPANSLTIARINPIGVETYTNFMLQLPSALKVMETASATVFGQKRGSWINLTSNTNHAVQYRSQDASIASVDASGKVAGLRAGVTAIVASYASLGLSATQMVEVLNFPRTLVHRYSFGEPGGTTVADSVGGASCNGSLPRGGNFSAGKLTLAGEAQQYVQLPPGILGSYTAVTVEAWLSFPSQLPDNCFFFGFGNTNGPVGSSYIFCAPKAGRIAVTKTDYHGEQNANSGVDLSYGTNLHFIAIFNPPGGYLSLYTNGSLAAINSAVTVPLSDVNDLYNYIGKSLYAADPYPDLVLDEFRIYSRELTANEILATEALGADQLLMDNLPSLQAAVVNNYMLLQWPVAAADYTLMITTNIVAGSWQRLDASPVIHNNVWQVAIPVDSHPRYFRLAK